MQNSQNKKKLQIVLLVLVAVLTLGIGYASITAVNLIINGNGTATSNQENFKVYFTDSSITEGKGTVSIDEDDPTIGYFDITGLSKEGDEATATYTVLNNSNGVGAQITLQLTNSNSDYFKVTETIEDDKLQAGEDTTATVKVEMIKTPLTDAVSTNITATLKSSPIEDADATGGSSVSKVKPVTFAGDSWTEIAENVRNNNTSSYHVGDTKTVTINGNNYQVRIVNKSTAQNCSDTNYSETACGFVVEFAEVVEKRVMNSTGTNIGGWPATEMRTYLNGTFYNSLSSDLQAAIKPTRVISGHGSNDADNFTSTDKVYLLSGTELVGADEYDTSVSLTHQLEYYVGQPMENVSPCGPSCGVLIDSYPRMKKQYQVSDQWYWLRSAYSDVDHYFRYVLNCGGLDYRIANDTAGIAPAFRIG